MSQEYIEGRINPTKLNFTLRDEYVAQAYLNDQYAHDKHGYILNEIYEPYSEAIGKKVWAITPYNSNYRYIDDNGVLSYSIGQDGAMFFLAEDGVLFTIGVRLPMPDVLESYNDARKALEDRD